MKRIFVAIKVVPNSNLKECFDSLKKVLRGDKIKWVEEENIHLTINFIGETPENKLNDIMVKLEISCKKFVPFSLQIKELGTFGANNNPRVVYMKIVGGGEFKELGEAINLALMDLAVQDKIKPIKPHLTLGRIKSIGDTTELNRLVNLYRDVEFQNFTVHEITLYESILTSKEPKYFVLRKFAL